MSFCSICTSERGPFTQQMLDGRRITVCAACDEPAIEKRGIERGYEPTGGLLKTEQAIEGARRVMGAEEYERRSHLIDVFGLQPWTANDNVENELRAYEMESRRIMERNRNTWAPNGRRKR